MGARFEDLFRVPPATGPLRDAWPLRTFLELAPLPTAVPCAALHARAVAGEWGLGRLGEAAGAAVAALAGSAVRACAQAPGQPPIRLRLCCDGARVLAVVRDASPRPPARPDLGEGESAARLATTAPFAADWGWMPVPGDGKLCWCLIL